MSHAVDDLQS